MANAPLSRLLGVQGPVGPALLTIGLVVASATTLFAFTAGWLTPTRLTPARVVDALGQRGGDPIGPRRNHSQGVCFTGYFEATGAGSAISTAPMFVAGRYPVVGRFAIGVGDPAASDAATPVRSMAVRITAPDGQEWRSGMNNSPVFVVSTPEAFYALTLASDLDPKTGKPDAGAMGAFIASHPESAAFFSWAKSAPWTGSFADKTYNSLNAFRFIDRQGVSRAVRWAMEAVTPAASISLDTLKARGPGALANDLQHRLAAGALRWRLNAILAAPGDPTANSTLAWPASRSKVALGTLVVQSAQAEANGPCRDYNFDPLILPTGIAPSDDPLLAARSASYAVSFDRRTAEAARYPRTTAPESSR